VVKEGESQFMEREKLMDDQGLVLKLPARQMLAGEVYEYIKTQLMDQQIQPGVRINIDKLARQLQISQTPIREALARLEAEELVTKEPLRGYSSTPLLDPSSFQQLYEMRLLIEPAAARKAAQNISEVDLLLLEQQVLAMQAVNIGETYKEYRQFSTADAAFHSIIARASGNTFLRDALERLHAHLHLYRLYFHTGIAIETISEHREILSALQQHNAEAAFTAMARHLQLAQRRLTQGFHS
jgi:DNA-binding GntR family transcriptional regulator